MRISLVPLCLSLAFATGCQGILRPRAIDAPELASAKSATDFSSYRLARVGVLPVAGSGLSPGESEELQQLCFSEFSEQANFELVLLSQDDLEEVEASEPYLFGVYQPETVLGISRRYKLDGLLVGSVSRRQSHPPLKLNMHIDLVASETGMTIWSASVALQADRPDVRMGVEAFYGNGQPLSDDSWAGALLSPSRFARFGIWQMARVL